MTGDRRAEPAVGSGFGEATRPTVARLMRALRLDVVYERGVGDELVLVDDDGRERRVLDLLGGYGASLLGHNHPELVDRVRTTLDSGWTLNAQGSVRVRAGRLASALSERVGRETGRAYVATFANSGAEAVEAALKHAALAHGARAELAARRVEEQVIGLRLAQRSGHPRVSHETLRRAADRLELPATADLEQLLDAVVRHNDAILGQPPRFLALERAFHGKTLGALALTHASSLRGPWAQLGPRTQFVPAGDVDALVAASAAATDQLLALDDLLEDGPLREHPWCHFAAAFVEPIQGEGGVHEMPTDYLWAMRGAADEAGFALVFDEIQTGMGRTGTFLASSQSGVRGDCYLLSKSLGGGLVKLSAMLVEANSYIDDFDRLHTSTFADDDLSSYVALGVLELLDRNDGALVRRCAEQGAKLAQRLRELAGRFPQVISGVRGRGLMLGLELRAQHASSSRLLRALSEQGWLGYAVCGHLLHEAGVRVAPTMSAPHTLRLQPSAYVSDADIDRACDALERVVAIVAAGDAHGLLGFLAGADRRGHELIDAAPPASPARARAPAPDAKVAFVGHFLQPDDVLAWDPSLAPLSPASCQLLLERTRAVLGPVALQEHVLRSATGRAVGLTVIGVPLSAEQLLTSFRHGENTENLALIRAALAMARGRGCTAVGFGGATSIVTSSCQDLHADDLCLTTGNSLTAAASMEALEQAVRATVGDPATSTLGIVGAMGNLGCALAELGEESFAEIVLVGRRGAVRRLTRVADTLYAHAFDRLRCGHEPVGVARRIAATETVRRLLAGRGAPAPGELRTSLEDELGPRRPVRVEVGIEAVGGCDAVVTATNAAKPVLFAHHLGERTRVICDVALPRDADPSLRVERPDVFVIRGGMIRLPLGQELDLPGMPADGGYVASCLAETVLLGMAGIREHFSRGPIEAQRARAVRELAAVHGFSVGIVAANGSP